MSGMMIYETLYSSCVAKEAKEIGDDCIIE